MNTLLRLAVIFAASFAVQTQAQSTFPEAIKAGDQARADKDYDDAIAAFEAAERLAGSPTDIAIARGKRAHLYAYALKDYESARAEAAAAIEIEEAHAVARVTALQVMAKVLMTADEDHSGAIPLLEEGVDLEGVDWAQPSLHLMLGDCYRATGSHEDALAAYDAVLYLPNANDGVKAVAHLNTGMTQQYNLRDPDAAGAAYAKAVELNPGFEQAVANHLSNMN
ncbi:MAG: tetratricopeptide repeat protein [Planctomycetota bacterium]